MTTRRSKQPEDFPRVVERLKTESICVGTAEFNGGNAALLEFRRRVSAARDGPPIYIFAPALVPHPYGPDGTNQLRVVMSTDPDSNSVVVMPP